MPTNIQALQKKLRDIVVPDLAISKAWDRTLAVRQVGPNDAVTDLLHTIADFIEGITTEHSQTLKHPTHVQSLSGSTEVDAVPVSILRAVAEELRA
jgi:hypothetical protein